jgi:hypothetical protein
MLGKRAGRRLKHYFHVLWQAAVSVTFRCRCVCLFARAGRCGEPTANGTGAGGSRGAAIWGAWEGMLEERPMLIRRSLRVKL